MPKNILALNWKMHKTPSEATTWASDLATKLGNLPCTLVIVAPAIQLPALATHKPHSVELGAQDISAHESGAYTGEISAAMLHDVGVKYAVIGHSERREYHGESDPVVAAKTSRAMAQGIIPIVCVGEKPPEREQNNHVAFTLQQLRGSLAGVNPHTAGDVVIAYEPVWAIGTGKTATAQDAEEMAHAIRGLLSELYPALASEIAVLYGGSVKAGNIKEICDQPNVNGALVGGASLEVDSVLAMVQALS